VVHLEGVTAGTDPRQGIKAYQVRNRQTFRENGADRLVSHPDHELPSRRRRGRRPRRVL
jgi:hypothetical protein